jgi:hypothetical protein
MKIKIHRILALPALNLAFFLGGLFAQEIPNPVGILCKQPPVPSEIAMEKGQIREIKFDGELSVPLFTPNKPLADKFSVTLWFRTGNEKLLNSNEASEKAPMHLLSMQSRTEKPNFLYTRLTNGRLRVVFNGGAGWVNLEALCNLEINKWYFAVLTKEGRTGRLYLNGRLTGTSSGLPAVPGLETFAFGRMGGNRWFDGNLFRPRFYDTILNEGQIKSLYQSSKPKKAELFEVQTVPLNPPSWGRYNALKVVSGEVHPLIDHHSIKAAPLDDPANPARKALLVSSPAPQFFGTRVALYRQSADANGLPCFENDVTLRNIHAERPTVVKHPDGSQYIYASGRGAVFDDNAIVRCKITGATPDGGLQISEPEEVLFDNQPLPKAFPGGVTWSIADFDGDKVPDFIVSCKKSASKRDAYYPDGIGFNVGREMPNTGPGKGYDIDGNWLGHKTTHQIHWAKGTIKNGSVSFGQRQPVYYKQSGFLAQWKIHMGVVACNVVELKGRRVLVAVGDVDKVLAMPITWVSGEAVLGDSAPLLASGVSMKGTFSTHSVTILENNPASCRLLLDGNPGELVVLEGNDIGNFKELGPIQTRGGFVSQDTLITPNRIDWDGDNYPDLIAGDASGLLGFWRGTSDPLVYHAIEYMAVDGKRLQHLAGPSGSMQGPGERRFGYLQPTVGDWDEDGTLEIITGDISSDLMLYKKAAGKSRTELASPETFTLKDKPYKPAWRGRAAIIPSHYNYGGYKRPVLLHLDWDGDLSAAVPERTGSTNFISIEKLRHKDGSLIHLCGPVGLWGRAKLEVTEWFADGKWHVLFGTASTVNRWLTNRAISGSTPFLLENKGTNEKPVFAPMRPLRLKEGGLIDLGAHNASIFATHMDSKEGTPPDLIIGAEDGKIYYFPRPSLAP